MSLRVAVVHDYLTQRGGAERVALSILQAFPGARLLTSLYAPDSTFPEFRAFDIETSQLSRLPAFRREPRLALPLLPGAFDRLEVRDVDVVVCSSTGFAHGVRTTAPKLVYCHNPPRWLYQPEDYLAGQPAAARVALRLLRPRLLSWDRRSAASAAAYLVNSRVVQQRVKAAYGREARVLPPPVLIDPEASQEPVPGVEPGFFLTVGRRRGYKNTTAVWDGLARLPDQRLVVVGGGPEPHIANITAVENVTDAQLRWLYASCTGLVSAAFEDFGLTPLEANAFGKPAVVLRAGGFLDTLVEGVTGRFIEEPTAEGVAAGVIRCTASSWDADRIRAHARTYSVEAFQSELRDVARSVVQ